MRRFNLAFALLAFFVGSAALAQSAPPVTVTFTFAVPYTGLTMTGTGPCSGTLTGTPTNNVAGPFSCGSQTIPAGTVIATMSVAPTGWAGGIGTSGTGAGLVTVTGSSPNYTVTTAQAVSSSFTVGFQPTP